MKKQVPTLEEFHEMRELYYGKSGMYFVDIVGKFVDTSGDFYEWWNDCPEGKDGEVEAFLKRYSKLGKLLAGVDDV